MQSFASGGVCNLIVVLKVPHECRRHDVESGTATPLPLTQVPLALVKPSPLEHRDQLLGRPEVITIVALPVAGRGDRRGMVEVFVPEHVEADSAPIGFAQQLSALRLALAENQDAPLAGRLAHSMSDLGKDVFGAGILESLRGIDSHAVEMKLVDPVSDIRENEFAHRPIASARQS